MFGKRPDGKLVKHMDPLVMITPYIMPQRVDAQVFLDASFEYEPLIEYISQKAIQGYKITFMEILISAFVRVIAHHPELNRFIINKKLYSRNELCVSLCVVKDSNSEEVEESVIKVKFDVHDTIFDVAARIKQQIDEAKNEKIDNKTLSVVKFLMKIPGLPNAVIGTSRILDKFGLLPKALIDILPFHTSMFITNMASIGVGKVYHHIYNYGTTSLFISMGAVEKVIKLDNTLSPKRKRILPIGITVDERVCAGKTYAKFFSELKKYLANPALLEEEPTVVRFDEGCEFSQEKPSHHHIKMNK